MKHKTLFRLSIKFLGVVLVAVGMTEMLSLIGVRIVYFIQLQQLGRSIDGQFVYQFVTAAVKPCVQVIIGLYLLIGGQWIINNAIPSNRPYCPDCGYDVSGASTEQCPECGSQLPANVRKIIEDD